MTRRRTTSGAVVLTAMFVLAGCGGSAEEEPAPTPTTTAVAPTPPPTAAPPPKAPAKGACYGLTYQQVLAPTSAEPPTACGRAHTSETYAVGELDTVVDGHLLAVDSDRVQHQVSTACPAALLDFLGGDQEALRLSMFRPLWFTPSVAQSDKGANWYRCDVVVVAADRQLAQPDSTLAGALAKPALRDRYAMCGTDAPDADDFERVICGAEHSWRAIQVVPVDSRTYPGVAALRDRLESPCEDAGLDVAADPLSYRWGYEYPTEEQWDMGQTWGLCWAPD
ncbi:septum formation family protein [Nocardioides sp. MH1]|uniref:septum formation family protein n=1 Tax=Nocardioides sp. MH1 TaxID=3242490 RepID=UPI00351FF2B3